MPLHQSLEVRAAQGDRVWGHLFIMEKSFSAHSGKTGREVSKSKIRGWRKGGSPYQVTSYEGSWPQKLWPLSQTGRGWCWLQKGQQDICIDLWKTRTVESGLGQLWELLLPWYPRHLIRTTKPQFLISTMGMNAHSVRWFWWYNVQPLSSFLANSKHS